MNAGGNRALVIDDGTLEGLLPITDVVRLVSWKKAGAALTSIPWPLVVLPAHEQRRRYAM